MQYGPVDVNYCPPQVYRGHGIGDHHEDDLGGRRVAPSEPSGNGCFKFTVILFNDYA